MPPPAAGDTGCSDQIFAPALRVSGWARNEGQYAAGRQCSNSGVSMPVASKQRPDVKGLATHLLTRMESLRDQPRVLAELLEGARELADQGEIDAALTVLRVVKLDRLRTSAAKSLKAELRSLVRSRSQSPTLVRRW